MSVCTGYRTAYKRVGSVHTDSLAQTREESESLAQSQTLTLLTWSWTSRLVCCELFVSRSLHSRRTAHTYMLSLSRSRCLGSPQSGFLDVDTKSAPLPAPGTAPHTSILEALARCASALATVCGVCSVLCGRWGSDFGPGRRRDPTRIQTELALRVQSLQSIVQRRTVTGLTQSVTAGLVSSQRRP